MKAAKTKADMAEWFKATDLRPVIYDAWVRTPLSATFYIFFLLLYS